MSDTTQKILIAIFSAFLGFALGWARDQRERIRRRAAIATAMLLDLHELEDSLQALATDPEPGDGFIPGTDEVMKSFVRDVALFKPATVSNILEIYSCLATVWSTQSEYSAGEISSPGYAHWIIQYYSRLALGRMASARSGLIQEGGLELAPLGDRAPDPPNLPPVPLRAFPAGGRTPSPAAISKFPRKDEQPEK